MTEKHSFMSQVSSTKGPTLNDNRPYAYAMKLGPCVRHYLLQGRKMHTLLTGPFGTSQDEHEVNTTAFGHHDPFNSSNGAVHDEPPPPYESVVMGEGVSSHLVRMF